MGLGYHVTVHRLETDELTRQQADVATTLVERLRAGDLRLGAEIFREGFSWATWVFDRVEAGDAIELSKAGGFPDKYLLRARHCPSLHEVNAAHPDEWVYVELWDEG